MPAIVPTSRVALPLANLRALIAATAAWQSWTETADDPVPATAAAESVFYIDLPQPQDGRNYRSEELQQLRPWIIVRPFVPPGQDYSNSYAAQRISGGSRHTFIDSGRLLLIIESDIPDTIAASNTDSMIWFMNQLGELIEDMLELSGVDDYFCILSLREHAPMTRCGKAEVHQVGDFFRVEYLIEWDAR